MQGCRAKQQAKERIISTTGGNIFNLQVHKICSMATDCDEHIFVLWQGNLVNSFGIVATNVVIKNTHDTSSITNYTHYCIPHTTSTIALQPHRMPADSRNTQCTPNAVCYSEFNEIIEHFCHEAQPVIEANRGADTDTPMPMPGGATMPVSGAGDGQRSDG
jgi:hypothetical protein